MENQSGEGLDNAGHSVPPNPRAHWRLFSAAQVPAILGIMCVVWWMSGGGKNDYFGAITGMVLMATFGGTLLSIVVTGILRAIGDNAYGRMPAVVLALYALYLFFWIVLIACVAMSDHPPRPGGGF